MQFCCVQLPLKKVMFSYVFHAANFYTGEVLRLPTAIYEKLVVNAINSARRKAPSGCVPKIQWFILQKKHTELRTFRTSLGLYDNHGYPDPLVNIQKAIGNFHLVDLPSYKMVIFHTFLYVYQAGFITSFNNSWHPPACLDFSAT